ncbi:prestin-like isoform X2 [Littorina saxatilis]|uniref:STAS domain-containing protein n=1 Tax=Littorina saxatilis TaxID=31220 RepID=A0AAN9B1R7_9CAEN
MAGDDNMNGDFKSSEGLGPHVRVNRSAYRLGTFRRLYLKPDEPPTPLLTAAKDKLGLALTCNKEKAKKTCHSVFPFMRIMRKYDVKNDLINDLIAGLTVGIMQLPQGMAYAMLADLPPVVGLYMSFFPTLIYFLFGTSKQISMGTVAVVSLMTGGIVARETEAWRMSRMTTIPTTTTAAPLMTTLATLGLDNTTAAAATAMDAEEIAYKIQIATSVAFITGLAQIGMGLCRIGFVTTYMGDSLVSGFTTGAAVHVFTSQVKYALGLKIPRYENVFQIIRTYGSIITNIPKTNIPEMVITLICIIILYIVKVQINQRIKDRCRIPIPIELIVVVTGTLASHYGNFREMWGIRTVGKIPAGLPEPSIPTFVNVSSYGFECVVVGIVAFAQSVSLAVLMAKKHHYDIDANKEMIGYGAGTLFGSFFSCYPIAASVSRSSVQDSAGGRSQLASVFSACLVLVVILFIGPLFQELPSCCLSAIIMVALRSMFLQVLQLRQLFRVSPFDCAIWVVTFLAVVILSVDLGLYIGIVFAFFTVVTRSQVASVKTMENLADNDIYKMTDVYTKTEAREGIRVITYNTPLYYANGEIFLKSVYRATGVKPEKLRKVLKRMQAKTALHSTTNLIVDESTIVELEPVPPRTSNGNYGKPANGEAAEAAPKDPRPFRHLVIDCSAMAFVDPVGIKTFRQLIEEFKGVGITVYLGGMRDEVWRTMEAADFTTKYADNIFLTVYDAVQTAENSLRSEVKVDEMFVTHM